MSGSAPSQLREGATSKRFLHELLVRCLLLLLATAALNLLVDPFGTYGTRVFEPIVFSTRGPKLFLYEQRRPRPEIVVLGSSRSFTVEPAYIEARTSRRAFNAAVHGARLADYLDLARCFSRDGAFPGIVIVGLGVEQVLGVGQPAERQEPLAKCHGPLGVSASRVAQRYRGLFTLEETWASVRTLALDVRGRPAPRFTFAADGLVLGSELPPQERAKLEQAVDDGLAGNWYPGIFAADGLEPRSVAQLQQLLELCRDKRARVVVYIPPFHPRATARYLRESHFGRLKAQLLDQLASWEAGFPLKVYDFTDVSQFGGSEEMFYDASHPTMQAYRRMLDVMLPALI